MPSVQKAVKCTTQGSRSQENTAATIAQESSPTHQRTMRNSQKTTTASVPPSVSSIDKDVKVVISEKDNVQLNICKKQAAHRGKKYTGVKPANVGNRNLSLKEKKRPKKWRVSLCCEVML